MNKFVRNGTANQIRNVFRIKSNVCEIGERKVETNLSVGSEHYPKAENYR